MIRTVLSRQVYTTVKTRANASIPIVTHRSSLWTSSRMVIANSSSKTGTASANWTPCFRALAAAFRGSHSNAVTVYECTLGGFAIRYANGGKTLYPKTAVGKNGFVAEFADSEGNRIALQQAANSAGSR
jgi:hypothetical protein